MVQKSFEKVYIAFASVWLFVLVWSAILGLPNMPSWNSFVVWFSEYLPDVSPVTDFFDTIAVALGSLKNIDLDQMAALVNSDSEGLANLIKMVGFLCNIFIVLLRTFGFVIYFFCTMVVKLVTVVIPMFMAFGMFLSGSVVANGLPGVVSQIDWGSMSGEFGYPDQSFVALVLPSFVIV